MGVGWSTDAAAEGSTAASSYTKFDTTTLAMRLPQGAAVQTAVRMKAAPVSNGSTYMNETQPFTLFDSVTNNLALLHNLNADTVASVANSQTVHYEGSFLVPEENAGSWTFTGQYDDYLTLEVDGVRRFSTGSASTSATATFALSAGWHSFRIAVVDGTGSYGGKLTDDNGKVCALKAKPANGAKTLAFDGENFRLAYSAADAQKMCAAGLGGEIDVGAGATLQNAAAAGFCPIYGTLKGSGMLSGAFRFTGTTNCWAVTQASVRELAQRTRARPRRVREPDEGDLHGPQDAQCHLQRQADKGLVLPHDCHGCRLDRGRLGGHDSDRDRRRARLLRQLHAHGSQRPPCPRQFQARRHRHHRAVGRGVVGRGVPPSRHGRARIPAAP